jgi:hypothetical protein
MQIISLIDNICSPEHPEIAVEHGISIAILLDDGRSILFDSGQSDAFLRNAVFCKWILLTSMRGILHITTITVGVSRFLSTRTQPRPYSYAQS